MFSKAYYEIDPFEYVRDFVIDEKFCKCGICTSVIIINYFIRTYSMG